MALLRYYTRTDKVVVENAFTVKGERLLRTQPILPEYLGERYSKLELMSRVLTKVMLEWEPTHIASESPYLGRFPQAFESLVECVYMLRMTTYRYAPHLYFQVLTPPTIKLNVGVPGNSNDKEDMRKALIKLNAEGVIDCSAVDINALDEHSVDAIAVGYCNVRRLRGDMEVYVRQKKKRSKKKRKKKA